MTGTSNRTPLWQIISILLGAPTLQAFLYVASGVSSATFRRLTFIWGATTEYVVFAVVLLFLRQRRVRLADLGLRGEGWAREVLVGIAAGVSLFVFSGILMVLLEPILPSTLSREARPPWAAWVYAVALVTAFAPIEEIVWRGYAIRCLGEHMRRWQAVLVASLAFGLMHWWGGPAHVVTSAIVGMAFSVLYLRRKTLVANIAAHVVLDLPLFLFMLFPLAT